MRLKIDWIPEPDLRFCNGAVGWEPKASLAKSPTGSEAGLETIQLGLVAFPQEVEPVSRWFDRMDRMIVSNESNARRFREFPGTRTMFGSRFEIPDKFIRTIDPQEYARYATRTPHDRFEPLLDLFSARLQSLLGDVRPQCILVCLPEELAELRITNPKLSWKEREILEQLQREDDDEQLALFVPSPNEMKLAAELRPQAEELLFRNFYRALKARCMHFQNAVPMQVLRRHTYVSAEARPGQSDSTRAWNLAVSLYYKSGHIPWRPDDLTSDTCFVGISFHHLKRRAGDIIYASLAQAFSNDTEPFTLKGGAIPQSQTRNRQPYLLERQAGELADRIVEEYKNRVGGPPARVVIHKTSRYQPEEESGFRTAFLAKVSGCDLVSFSPTGFRVLRRNMSEPWRGTLCTVGDNHRYLFTTGFVPTWDEYPGPHIPAPLQISAAGADDIRERAREVLALTKINWNSAEGIGRHPITISFARKVGMIMTEIPEDVPPNPLYRFYM